MPTGMNKSLLIHLLLKQRIKMLKTPNILMPLQGSPIQTPC